MGGLSYEPGAAPASSITRRAAGLTVVGSLIAASLAIASCSGVNSQNVNFPLHVKKERELSTPGAGVAVAWSPDGSRLAAASDFGGTITVWDRSGRQISQFKRNGGGPALGGWIAFAAGSSHILFECPDGVADGAAFTVWDATSGRILRSVDGPEPKGDQEANRATKLSISPDQQRVIIATSGLGDSEAGVVRDVAVYDPQAWRLLRSYTVGGTIFALTPFAGNHGFVVGTGDGTVAVLKGALNAVPIIFQAIDQSEFGSKSVGAVAASPDGSMIFEGPFGGSVDGRYAGRPESIAWDRANVPARVLDSSNGKRLASFSVASRLVRRAVWDPLGRYVAFVDGAGSLYMWRPLAPTLSYLTITLPGEGYSLAISPDGREIAATADTGVVIYSVQ